MRIACWLLLIGVVSVPVHAQTDPSESLITRWTDWAGRFIGITTGMETGMETANTEDTLLCDNAAPPQLQPDHMGEVAAPHDRSLEVRDYPVGPVNARLSAADRFLVLDGPTCMTDGAWWKVELDSGLVGWLRESDGMTYNVLPVEAE